MEHLDLTDVAQFIEERDLVPEKYRRYYLYWMRRFLLNPEASNPALTAEDCLRVYVQDLTRDPQVRDWQVDQAERAMKLYLFTYLPARNLLIFVKFFCCGSRANLPGQLQQSVVIYVELSSLVVIIPIILRYFTCSRLRSTAQT